jgi:hypothetical protein
VLRVTQEGPWMATLRDISTDGVGLVTSEVFAAGTLLTIELPVGAAPEQSRRLLRVRYGRRHSGSHWWTLGCAFVKPLSAKEVDQLRKKSPQIFPAQERRSKVRHNTKLRHPCRVLRATEEGEWSLTIRNVSTDGVGLIADRPFRSGMYLTAELPGRKKPAVLRVAHVRKQPNHDWWVLGCSFVSKMTALEVQALM